MTTYVLVGHDHSGTFEGDIQAWEERSKKDGDVAMIYAKPDQDLQSAMKDIKESGNVVLVAHGATDGKFQWNKDEWISYSQMYSALPRHGIEMISIGACFGGTAVTENMLSYAPPGALVHAMVNSAVLRKGDSGQSTKEIIANKAISPFIILLENIDAVEPVMLAEAIKKRNVKFNEKTETDPEKMLPNVVGIGGNPSRLVNLSDEMARLHEKIHLNDENSHTFSLAISAVKNHFDSIFGASNKGSHGFSSKEETTESNTKAATDAPPSEKVKIDDEGKNYCR